MNTFTRRPKLRSNRLSRAVREAGGRLRHSRRDTADLDSSEVLPSHSALFSRAPCQQHRLIQHTPHSSPQIPSLLIASSPSRAIQIQPVMSTGIVNSSEGRPHCASITWTIDAFKDLTGRIESPPIQLSTGTRLKLSLDSKSSLSGDKYITIQLHSYESDFISRITFVKANGTKGHRTGFQQHYHSGDQHITTSYIEGLEVLNMANGYLVDGKLTVHCDVVDSDNDVISNEKHSTFDYHHVPSALLSLLEGAKYSDVTFVVGGKEFAVHKNILASRSPVFDAMFSQEFREKTEKKVKLPDISVEVFERLLRGIYTGQLRSLEKYAEELLAATNKYQVDDLKKQATQFLIPRITTDSAITLLLLADMHQSTELKSECIKYITANLASVKATEGWKHLKENNSKHSDLLLELLEAMAE